MNNIDFKKEKEDRNKACELLSNIPIVKYKAFGINKDYDYYIAFIHKGEDKSIIPENVGLCKIFVRYIEDE